MKRAILLLLICTSTSLLAQKQCVQDFKLLQSLSKNATITNAVFDEAVLITKKLESNKCADYAVNKTGVETVAASRTELFGGLCLKKNNLHAVTEYINYMKRQHGSAEEELSFLFERLFVQRPEDVLVIMGNSKDLINQLAWGFVNNHYEDHVTTANYKATFYKINPKIKRIYPQYKNQIDKILAGIASEL
jgi:hypothetical protein